MRGRHASQPSRGTLSGAPQTSTPRPHGSGSTMRSQVGSTRRRVVCAAQGTTGARVIAASWATPGAAWRGGPRGPSGVITTWPPPASAAASARSPAAPPRCLRRSEVEPNTTSTPNPRMMSPISRPSLCWLTSTCICPRGPPRRSSQRQRPQRRHERQPLMPEREDRPAAQEVRPELLSPMQGPARGPERELQIGPERPGPEGQGSGMLEKPLHTAARGSMAKLARQTPGRAGSGWLGQVRDEQLGAGAPGEALGMRPAGRRGRRRAPASPPRGDPDRARRPRAGRRRGCPPGR